MGRRAIDARGLAVVLGLTLAVDLVIRPFSQRNGIRAQVFAPAALLDGLAVLALTAPLLRALTPAVRARMGAVWTRGARCAPFLVLFAFAAGGAAVRAEQFLRYVSDAPLPRMAVYALVLAAAFYAMRCGAETLARVCGVLAWLFGLSVVILLASNAGGMAIVNLETDVFDPAEWALTAARGFSLPAQIVLFFWLALGARDDLRRPYRRTLLDVILLAMVLSVAAELVLGSQAQMQNRRCMRCRALAAFRCSTGWTRCTPPHGSRRSSPRRALLRWRRAWPQRGFCRVKNARRPAAGRSRRCSAACWPLPP